MPAHRSQPPHRRPGGDYRALARLSSAQRHHGVRARHAARDPGQQRLQHLLRRQVAPDPTGRDNRSRPLRQVAARPRLRALLRLPWRRHRPVSPRAHLRQPLGAGARHASRGLPPQRRPGRSRHRLHQGRARGRSRQAVPPLVRHRLRSRAPSGRAGVGQPLPWSLRRGLGCLSGRGLRAPEGARTAAGGCRAF